MGLHSIFLPVGPLACNCSIIYDEESKEGIIIDPGGDGAKLVKILADHEIKLCGIYHSHAHFDHFLASGEIKEKTSAAIYLHENDLPLWKALPIQCSMFRIPCPTHMPDPDFPILERESLSIGAFRGEAMHTPGHTPGSVSYFFSELDLLVAGDTLFREGIGRTDLWGGDANAIRHSIQKKLFSLPPETKVITGHGPSTTIGHEVKCNPFL